MLSCASFSDHLNRIGEIHEWHVYLFKSFEHIKFGLVSWFAEVHVSFVPAFKQAWFESVRSIGNAVGRDRIKESLVKVHAQFNSTLVLDLGLKGFECLKRPFEANGSWLD